MSEEEGRAQAKKMQKGTFDFNDFLFQVLYIWAYISVSRVCVAYAIYALCVLYDTTGYDGNI